MLRKIATGFNKSLAYKPLRNYYKYVSAPKDVKGEQRVPLYRSSTFAGLVESSKSDISSFVSTIFGSSNAHEKYLLLVPFFIEQNLQRHRKNFVVDLQLLPDSERLQFTCLTCSGFVTKYAELKNFVPVIYEDYRHTNRKRLFDAPPFVDEEMVFYNSLNSEFYIFDKVSQWHEQNINHPSLDVNKLFQEKKWFDELRIV